MNQHIQSPFPGLRPWALGLFMFTLTALALTTHSGAAASANDLCGTTIVTDLTLDQDLACAGNGLVVGADNITIDLNGHTIAGPGTAIGIRIALRTGVTVRGGTVRHFETGIMVANSSNVTVKENDLTETREGVFLNGTINSVVKENHAWLNQLRGVMIRPSATRISTGNLVVENLLNDNPIGILLFGQPDNTIRENTIAGSTIAGIQLIGGGASGNLFHENRISTSLAAVQFGPGWTGNKFVENRFTSNACALQGGTTGNTFRSNVFSNNAADSCQ